MEKSASFFHRVNGDLVINLAEVAFAENRETYYRDCLAQGENIYIQQSLDAGKVCVVGLRAEQDEQEGARLSSGQYFDLSVEEFAKLQEALQWYNKQQLKA